MAPNDPRRIEWARWGLGAAAAAVSGVVLFALLAPRPTAVDAGVVSRGPFAEVVADQGFARVRDAYVVAAPVSGRLERLELDVGDRVQAGVTVVARIRPASAELLDPRDRARAEAAVAAAVAAVAAARAQHEELTASAVKAEADLSRTRRLAAGGFASAQGLEASEADALARRAAVQAAAAMLEMRRAEVAAARAALLGSEASSAPPVKLTSPATGQVTRLLQESERVVAVGSPILEVSDGQGLEAAIEFLSQDAARIREGMAAEVYDWGGPGPIRAFVRRVEPQGYTKVSALGVEEQRALVLLQLAGNPHQWKGLGPGYRVWGRVVVRRAPQAVKAPLGALVRRDGGWAVYRIAGGRARLVRVEVGAFSDTEAEIGSGLRPGDRVVVFPSDRVRDGGRVKVRDAT